jgi:hypothetical protein
MAISYFTWVFLVTRFFYGYQNFWSCDLDLVACLTLWLARLLTANLRRIVSSLTGLWWIPIVYQAVCAALANRSCKWWQNIYLSWHYVVTLGWPHWRKARHRISSLNWSKIKLVFFEYSKPIDLHDQSLLYIYFVFIYPII